MPKTQPCISRILILILVSSFACGCASRQAVPVGEIPQAIAPTKQDKQVSRAMIEQTMEADGYELLQKGSTYRRTKKILNRLEVAAGVSAGSYPLFIAEGGDSANAFAFNSNSIVVFKTLTDRVPQDNQLATIMAHEVAHILARHTDDKSEESRAKSVSLGSSILGSLTSTAASMAGLGSYASRTAGNLTQKVTSVVGDGAIVKSYSRGLESEADHVGLMLMAKAGYNPKAAIEFWNRSSEIFGGESGIEFLSTHPSGGSRLEGLTEAMPLAMEYYSSAKVK